MPTRYPDTTDLPNDLQEVLSKKPLNVFRMIMHSPGLARGYLAMAQCIQKENALPGPQRELVILRVGHVYRASYEVFHHERLARAAGLSEAGIVGAAVGERVEGLTDREWSLLKWTDRLLAEHELTGLDRDEALNELGHRGMADLVLTVGFYQLVCNFLRTFDVQVEN